MNSKKIYGPWIKWHGGECPVPSDTLAALKALTGKSSLTSEARSEFAFLVARAFEASMSKAKGDSNA